MGITIEDLAVAYGGQRVIDGLALTIEPGSFFTLLGPSGCGKTTLLRTIAGFVPAERGHMRFGGTEVTHLPPHKRDIGMCFQDYALFPDKTVFDNVAYGLRARKQAESAIKPKVQAALERVGLGHLGGRHPAALSGGQRQRVALARALVIQPKVLLMDEPLSNLDAKLRLQVRETIVELQREAKITTVFVTHDREEALAMSDRIGVMNQGRLEQVGTPAQIYREPRTGYVADFVGGANIVAIETAARQAGETGPVGLDGASITAYAPAAIGAGKATLVARPEDILLAEPGSAGTLPARIAHRQYLGGKTSYKVTLDSGRTLAVDLQSGAHDRFEPGATVGLGFDPARTLVLAS
ncbi:Fe(3+) ions import ATP-binding protein FbpC [Hyphomicrobiales bacterium]|nr:Fe(3+) ions import ATP-binding protein FbpC [Hyphomicrobiales bacterium]CAH1698958.1 Fe(3+) ions import ATP-binding protein FbpC [Hyphomicrobiales bacterium]CAI0342603.1 Fe(3+) ions import ATP-binding protein FbpC [Hyphomicrobiales bacterium]